MTYNEYEKLRDSKGLKNADVARIAMIPPSTFTDWKNGKSAPKIEKISKIMGALGVSLEYSEHSEESQKNDFSHEELDLIRTFRTLSATNREVIKATIKAMLEQEQITKKADLKSYKEA